MRDRWTDDQTRRAFEGGGCLLDADELLQSALTHGRRSDFADPKFAPSLRRLIAACNREANLSALGARPLRFDILRCLRNLLRFDELEARDPAVVSRPIEAPIFITGMPRSGTTFLHRLILQDPTTCAPRLFQLVHPCASKSRWIETAVRRTCVRLQLILFRMIARSRSTSPAPRSCSRPSRKRNEPSNVRRRSKGTTRPPFSVYGILTLS
jgi:hypothetical protein